MLGFDNGLLHGGSLRSFEDQPLLLLPLCVLGPRLLALDLNTEISASRLLGTEGTDCMLLAKFGPSELKERSELIAVDANAAQWSLVGRSSTGSQPNFQRIF